jgi:hypothetical protein
MIAAASGRVAASAPAMGHTAKDTLPMHHAGRLQLERAALIDRRVSLPRRLSLGGARYGDLAPASAPGTALELPGAAAHPGYPDCPPPGRPCGRLPHHQTLRDCRAAMASRPAGLTWYQGLGLQCLNCGRRARRPTGTSQGIDLQVRHLHFSMPRTAACNGEHCQGLRRC